MSDSEKYQPTITITKNKLSMAFSLITFMVGEVLFIEKAIACPVDVNKFPEINEDDFLSLKQKQLEILNKAEKVVLDEEESLLLYLLVDIVCRCFVGDANIFLEERAAQIMEIGKEEYKQVRHSYIHYAQSLITEINNKFDKSTKFIDARARLSN